MAAPAVHRTATVALPEGGGRIAVVADTHSRPHPAIDRLLAAQRPAAILHAGDIGDGAVLDGLAAHAPVHAVRGNIDGTANAWPDVLVIDVTVDAAAARGALRIFLTHIAVVGPRLRADVATQARDAGAQLVVCGHSHVPFIGRDKGLTVFNPGSIGPRRFTLPIVFGTIDVGDRVRLAHHDAETGATWSP